MSYNTKEFATHRQSQKSKQKSATPKICHFFLSVIVSKNLWHVYVLSFSCLFFLGVLPRLLPRPVRALAGVAPYFSRRTLRLHWLAATPAVSPIPEHCAAAVGSLARTVHTTTTRTMKRRTLRRHENAAPTPRLWTQQDQISSRRTRQRSQPAERRDTPTIDRRRCQDRRHCVAAVVGVPEGASFERVALKSTTCWAKDPLRLTQ